MSKKAMKHSAEIYNELKGVSPFLAEVEKTNVFSVPEDYFSALDKQFLQKIKDDLLESFQERENSSFTLPASEPHFLDVPEGYFDNLPTNILRKIKSLEINTTNLIFLFLLQWVLRNNLGKPQSRPQQNQTQYF